MNTEKLVIFIRRVFIALATIGLVLNVAFDFIAFRKNQESDEMGVRVTQAFQSLIHLERMKSLLNEGKFHAQNPSIQLELEKFLNFQSNQINASRIEDLKSALATSSKAGLENLNSLSGTIMKEIASLQSADTALDAQVASEMMRALLWDLGLIGAMLLLFILNANAKRKVEHNLKVSLFNMRESLMSLEERAFSRSMTSKMVVHDLKNPIGTIREFAQLLLDDPKSELTVAEFSQRIRQISERSLLLVESLLYENESDRIIKRKVDIIPILQDVSSQFEIHASKKSQKIVREIKTNQGFVLGNVLKLEELISNILSNAIKYSPLESKIKIKAFESGDFLQIEVEDQGPGFSETDKKNAFQFGKKLSAAPTNNESSTGYGLYIVKQIVESSNGEVEILDSTSGLGARIVIRLPLCREKVNDSRTDLTEL